MTESKNMDLWLKVEKTPKDLIREIEVENGKKLKTVPSINRIKKATEIFGIYGENWGLKKVVHSEQKIFNNLILGIIEAEFYVNEKDNKTNFFISNSISIVSLQNKEMKINTNYRKALETDTINKALSRLGFNADIYTDDDLVKTEKQDSEDLSDVDFIKIGDN